MTFTDSRYEQHIYSDSQFLKDALKRMEKQEECVTVVAGGAYAGQKNEQLATEKNVRLVTTSFTSREVENTLADFEISKDDRNVVKCPDVYELKSCSYNQGIGQYTVSFLKEQCTGCPYKAQCHPKMFKQVCRKTVSATGKSVRYNRGGIKQTNSVY